MDTRGAAGTFGGPPLSPGTPRDFPLPTGPCPGIPPFAAAYSLNFTVTNTTGPGDIRVYPEGASVPLASTLNYVAGQAVANAAIVPAGTGGGISVQADVHGANLIIDINGFYAWGAAGADLTNSFLGSGAGNFTLTGSANTAIGNGALLHDVSGAANTASGYRALFLNSTGSNNTAAGVLALELNTDGSDNAAFGESALGVSTGSLNIGVGKDAGANLTSGDNNIFIGTAGIGAESNTIRIGEPGAAPVHSRTFIAGIRGVTTGSANAIPVVIDSSGQLGTVSSSARFKEEIRDMADASSRVMELRPVTFHYRGRVDEPKQYGLIAEEVEDVLPELVVCDGAGEAEMVLYQELPAMLLNELKKEDRRVNLQASELEQQALWLESQAGEIAQLKAELGALRAAIARP